MSIWIAILPLLIGFALDALIGDPYQLPHPIRWIGRFISCLEGILRKGFSGRERLAGWIEVVLVLMISTILPLLVLLGSYWLNVWVGIAVEGILCYYLLAARCLRNESMKVYRALQSGDVEQARQAVSMIVGRDTEKLTAEGITKAAVETVAENTSDGVTAPIFYMMLGGAVGGFFYKAANTMDSMLGYKNEKYLQFGRMAAKLDDVLNYLPSRLTALFMIAAAFILRMDGRSAYRIWKRDRRNHASPNSAQTEAACAGALQVMLAGDAYYFGKLHKKKTIGDDVRSICAEDIPRANQLMYVTSLMMLFLAVILRGAFYYLLLLK